ncbi:MAG: sarcosine oxidase subunit gamma [Leisingera sp.]
MSAAEAHPLFCLEGIDLTGAPAAGGPAGVDTGIVTDSTVLRIMPFRVKTTATAAALAPFGFTALPAPGRFAEAGDHCLAWAASNCWHLISSQPVTGLEQELKRALSGLAAVSSAGGGLLRLQISGKDAGALMVKGCVLDLDRFEPGHCAVTLMAHTRINLLRRGGTEFDLLIPVSHAASFWEWLTMSAAEFGMTVSAGPVQGPGRSATEPQLNKTPAMAASA